MVIARPRRFLIPLVAMTIIGIAVIWAGNVHGSWWITPLVGFVMGLFLIGAWTIVAAALAGLLGWGLELAWQAITLPIGRAASVTAGIMGFGTTRGYVVVAVTLLLGLLLCLCGAWLGAALRRLISRPRTVL